MHDSIRLGRYAGISVGLHWSIGIIVALLTVTLSETILPEFAPGHPGPVYLMTALLTAALFLASIAAHELGHSVVAVRNGVRVRGITLFALGGVARLDSEPDDPGAAARIAAAGPAVSVAIGVTSVAVAVGLAALGVPALLVAGLAWLGIINLSLAVFNLLPVFPLDGGRILQAVLWRRGGDRSQATITAATIGRYGGWGLVLFGLWQLFQGGFGLTTILIGGFVILTARAEAYRARLEQRWSSGGGGDHGPFGYRPGPAGPGPSPFGPAATGHDHRLGRRPSSRQGRRGDIIDVGPGRVSPGPDNEEEPREREDRHTVGASRVRRPIPPDAGLGEPGPIGFSERGEHGPQDRAGDPRPDRVVTGQLLVVGRPPKVHVAWLEPTEVVSGRRQPIPEQRAGRLGRP